VRERLMDAVADRLGLDRLTVRRRNLIAAAPKRAKRAFFGGRRGNCAARFLGRPATTRIP
jgi:CO/xanthine dehydrogenase Mo-binding subunit